MPITVKTAPMMIVGSEVHARLWSWSRWNSEPTAREHAPPMTHRRGPIGSSKNFRNLCSLFMARLELESIARGMHCVANRKEASSDASPQRAAGGRSRFPRIITSANTGAPVLHVRPPLHARPGAVFTDGAKAASQVEAAAANFGKYAGPGTRLPPDPVRTGVVAEQGRGSSRGPGPPFPLRASTRGGCLTPFANGAAPRRRRGGWRFPRRHRKRTRRCSADPPAHRSASRLPAGRSCRCR